MALPPENGQRPSLLLLPVSQHPETEYRPPLAAALLRLSQAHAVSRCSPPPVVVIAVQASASCARWTSAQTLIATVYALVASICSRHAIPCDPIGDEAGTVDARLILATAHSTSHIANLTSLADIVSRPWENVFYPSYGLGRALLEAFVSYAEEKHAKLLPSQIIALDSETHAAARHHAAASDVVQEPQKTDERYSTVCLGGTFDHLHPGHKLLLHAAVMLLRIPWSNDTQQGPRCTLIVGISGDELLVKKQFAEELQPWDSRAHCVMNFLATVLDVHVGTCPIKVTSNDTETRTSCQSPTHNNTKRPSHPTPRELHAVFCNGTVLIRCVDIRDPYGPTIAEQPIDAIVVSAETRVGALAINERRRDRGWHELQVFEIDVLDAAPSHGDHDMQQDTSSKVTHGHKDDSNPFASKISSTEIRRRKAEARRQSQLAPSS